MSEPQSYTANAAEQRELQEKRAAWEREQQAKIGHGVVHRGSIDAYPQSPPRQDRARHRGPEQMSSEELSRARGDDLGSDCMDSQSSANQIKPPPDVREQMSGLHMALAETYELARNIRARLDAVLRPPSQEPVSSASLSIPASTPLGCEIAQDRLFIVDIARVLEDILHRLEV